MAISVSTEWHEAVKAQFRYPAYLKCRLRLTPPGLMEHIQAASNDTSTFSDIDILVDRTRKEPVKYATLERKRWKLDGSWKNLSENTITTDWWSQPTTANRSIMFSFNAPYSIPGVYFEWDAESNTWPEQITINALNSSKQLISSSMIDSISSVTGFIDLPMDEVQYVEIIINKWNKPDWRARINEVMFGVNIDYDSINSGRITSANSTDASTPFSSRLPIHDIAIKLRNIDKEFDPLLRRGVAKYLSERQRIRYQWGFTTSPDVVEWTDYMDYYIDTVEIPKDSKDVSIACTSRLNFLTDPFVRDTYTGQKRSFMACAIQILQTSGIIREDPSEIPWALNDKLSMMYTSAPIPYKACNYLLQLIAGATCTWLRTDPITGFVRIDDLDLSTPVNEITLDQELGDPKITLQKPLKSISIAVYKYIRVGTATEIAMGDYQLSGTVEVTMSYNVVAAAEVEATITGATLIKAEYYSAAAILTIEAPELGTIVHISLVGVEIKGQPTYINSFNDSNITQGINVTLENPLITEVEYVAQLTAWLRQWYQKRQQYEVEYLGYPEMLAGDQIKLTTIYGEQPATVTSNKIKFNGGWSGTAEVL